MYKKKQDHHHFALYHPDVSSFLRTTLTGEELLIADEAMYHRMNHVLRLHPGESCLLFDRSMHAEVLLERFVDKKGIVVTVVAAKHNIVYTPSIRLFLPLLKKDAFEQALYNSVELGADEVHLITTSKQQSTWSGHKELRRINTIMIAAAEQSKNFAFPLLHEPKSLEDVLATHTGVSLLFDAAGGAIEEGLRKAHGAATVNVFIGPEGDFTAQEKQLFSNHAIQSYALTPTILRSVQAVAVSLGILRTFLK